MHNNGYRALDGTLCTHKDSNRFRGAHLKSWRGFWAFYQILIFRNRPYLCGQNKILALWRYILFKICGTLPSIPAGRLYPLCMIVGWIIRECTMQERKKIFCNYFARMNDCLLYLKACKITSNLCLCFLCKLFAQSKQKVYLFSLPGLYSMELNWMRVEKIYNYPLTAASIKPDI